MRLFIVRWLLALLLAPAICAAQVSPVQKAVSGIVQSKMSARGVTSNTASWGGTLKGMGLYIGSAAATAGVLTLAGVSAPAWLTAGIAMGIAAVLDGPVSLAVDGVSKWLFNSDGTISHPSTSTDPETSYLPMVQGGAYYQVVYGNFIWKCGSAYSCAMAYATAKYESSLAGVESTGCGPAGCGFNIRVNYYNGVYETAGVSYYSSGAPASCAAGSNYIGGACVVVGVPTESVGSPISAQESVAALPEAERQKPLNPAIIAAVADRAWKEAAAQPGYTGVPYDAANPISAADAAAYQSANASSWPTVGDFVAPQAAPAGGTAADAYSLPNSAAEPVPTTSTPPVTADQQSDMDWAIGDTGEGVPRQSVPVSYTPTIFAAPTGCPASISVTMFDKTYAISWQPMCDLMSTLAPIFLACGAAAAALIFAESLKS